MEVNTSTMKQQKLKRLEKLWKMPPMRRIQCLEMKDRQVTLTHLMIHLTVNKRDDLSNVNIMLYYDHIYVAIIQNFAIKLLFVSLVA